MGVADGADCIKVFFGRQEVVYPRRGLVYQPPDSFSSEIVVYFFEYLTHVGSCCLVVGYESAVG